MKVLCTADWHIGKKLYSHSRLEEQQQMVSELISIADSENVDIITIAGDIFDTKVPSSEAEDLFYNSVSALSEGRIVIAIAGNHDDAERLAAPDSLAAKQRVLLCGGVDYSGKNYTLGDFSVTGKFGGYVIEKKGERLNVLVLPYPSEPRLDFWFGLNEQVTESASFDYGKRVATAFDKMQQSVFSDNGFNLAVTHLFLGGSETGGERTLGNAMLLSNNVLPNRADYISVGHIHKPMSIKNAHYAGAPLRYAFDESENKSVVILDTATKESKRVNLHCGLPLLQVESSDFDSAYQTLSEQADSYKKLIFHGSLTLSQSKKLADLKNYCAVEIVNDNVDAVIEKRSELTDEQLFIEFYKNKRNGAQPDSELVKLFLSALAEVE